MSRHLIIAAAAAVAILTGCETTGDPNQGGYLGWSQKKSDQRVFKLRNELSVLDQDSGNLKMSQSELKAERTRLNNRIAELERELGQSLTPGERTDKGKQLAAAKAELRRLEKQAGMLQDL